MDPKQREKLAQFKEQMEGGATESPADTLSSETLDYQEHMTERHKDAGHKINQTIIAESSRQNPDWRDKLADFKEQIRPKLEQTDPKLHRRMQMRLDDQSEGRPYRTARELDLAIEKEQREADRKEVEAKADLNRRNRELFSRDANYENGQSYRDPLNPGGEENGATMGATGQSHPQEYYEEKYSDFAGEFDDEPSYEKTHQDKSNLREFMRRERDRTNLNYAHKTAAREAIGSRSHLDEKGHSIRNPGPISQEGVERWEAEWQNRQEAAINRVEQSKENHVNRTPESVYDRSDRAFNYYENQFEKHRDKIVSRSLTRGFVDAIEKGNFGLPTGALLRRGFWEMESERFDKRIDPEGILSGSNFDMGDEEILDAKRSELSNEKLRLEAKIKRKILNEYARTVSDEELQIAEYKASLFAINTGARIDSKTGEVVFTIPANHGEQTRVFMENAGIDFKKDSEVTKASYQGFANIIEAIKGEDHLTEKGFATLDWYFDNFNYQEHIGDFLNKMDVAGELADEAWGEKYEEYMQHRQEREEFFKKQAERPLPTIESVEKISDDNLVEGISDILNADDAQFKEALSAIIKAPLVSISPLVIFPDNEQGPIQNRNTPPQPSNTTGGPSSKARAQELLKNYIDIKRNIDPNIQPYKAVFTESNGKKIPYFVLEFQQNNSNVAIAVPVVTGNNAGYVWVGPQQSTSLSSWMDAFVQNPNPNTPTSKYQARQRSDTKAFNHIAAPKQHRNAAHNIWFNIRGFIDRVA